MIAVFVVALGSASATSLIVSAIQANGFSKDSLVALNLAVEGIEAMRDIRDTNWIKYGFDKSNCWNLAPDPDPLITTPCTAPYDLIDAGFYSADLNPTNYSWSLSTVYTGAGNALDLSDPLAANNENYRLGFVDLSGGTSARDIYVTAPFITTWSLPGGSGDSKFYRMITISYDTGDPATAEVMSVTSTVQWEQNGVHTVDLSISLSNYQKVPTP